MKLANNSRELAKQATTKLKDEQERMQKIMREKERSWKAQLEALEIELKAFRANTSQQLPGIPSFAR